MKNKFKFLIFFSTLPLSASLISCSSNIQDTKKDYLDQNFQVPINNENQTELAAILSLDKNDSLENSSIYKNDQNYFRNFFNTYDKNFQSLLETVNESKKKEIAETLMSEITKNWYYVFNNLLLFQPYFYKWFNLPDTKEAKHSPFYKDQTLVSHKHIAIPRFTTYQNGKVLENFTDYNIDKNEIHFYLLLSQNTFARFLGKKDPNSEKFNFEVKLFATTNNAQKINLQEIYNDIETNLKTSNQKSYEDFEIKYSRSGKYGYLAELVLKPSLI